MPKALANLNDEQHSSSLKQVLVKKCRRTFIVLILNNLFDSNKDKKEEIGKTDYFIFTINGVLYYLSMYIY